MFCAKTDSYLQNRLKLHGVAIPPGPLRGMIFQTTFRLAFWTNTAVPTMLQSDGDRLRCHIQLNTRDIPRLVQTQQQPIMRSKCLHAQTPF